MSVPPFFQGLMVSLSWSMWLPFPDQPLQWVSPPAPGLTATQLGFFSLNYAHGLKLAMIEFNLILKERHQGEVMVLPE